MQNNQVLKACSEGAFKASPVVSSPFHYMGFSNQKLYFFVNQTQTPIALPIAKLKAPWIFALAPLAYWQNLFPTDDRRCLDKVRWRIAAAELIEKSYAIGVYKGVPEFMKTLKKGAK